MDKLTGKKKILFLDLDDTLLNSRKEITPGNEEAISAAFTAGKDIVVCTGRPLCATRKILSSLHLDRKGCYAICFNGAQIYDCFKKEAVFCSTLPQEDVRYIFREADKAGIHAQTYDSESLLCRFEDKETKFYVGKTNSPLRLLPSLPEGLTEDPCKVLLIDLHDHAKLEAFRDAQSEWARGRISAFFSNPMYLEFVKEGISKGDAILRLCDHLGIPQSETIGAGDSENDLPMLKACAVGCAMANAEEECKNAADYITYRDCNHDGVAEIIEKFLL